MPPFLDTEHDDTTVLEDRPEQIKPPPRFVCVLKNDDFTSMEFVVEVLMAVFKHTEDEAVAIMFAVHQKGQGVAGKPTSRDVAETRRAAAMDLAKESGHPLQCLVKEV
jgi:ATP-dependent Clp protease adaptor protein ClpS